MTKIITNNRIKKLQSINVEKMVEKEEEQCKIQKLDKVKKQIIKKLKKEQQFLQNYEFSDEMGKIFEQELQDYSNYYQSYGLPYPIIVTSNGQFHVKKDKKTNKWKIHEESLDELFNHHNNSCFKLLDVNDKSELIKKTEDCRYDIEGYSIVLQEFLNADIKEKKRMFEK